MVHVRSTEIQGNLSPLGKTTIAISESGRCVSFFAVGLTGRLAECTTEIANLIRCMRKFLPRLTVAFAGSV
jgi:hypothetical protein